MPRFLITAPDGTKYQLDGPDGSTADDALKIVQAQHPAAPASTPAIDTMPTPNPAATQGKGVFGNVSDFLENTNAGIGGILTRGGNAYQQAANTVGQGLRAILPAAANAALDRANTSSGLSTADQATQSTNAAIQEHARLDKPLDATVGGKTGGVIGMGLMAAPASLAGGGIMGSVAANSLLSALMTPGGVEQRGFAALGGGAGTLGGQAIGSYANNFLAQRAAARIAQANPVLVNDALSAAGRDASSVPPQTLAMLKSQQATSAASGKTFDPVAALRQAEGDAVLGPENSLTLGQRTRDPQQFANEQNIRGTEAGKPLADRFNGQSNALIDYLNQRGAAAAPAPIDTGNALISALRGVDENASANITNLYNNFRSAGGIGDELPGTAFAQKAGDVIDTFGRENVPGAVLRKMQDYGFLGGTKTKTFNLDEADKLNKVINANYDPSNKAQASALDGLRSGIKQTFADAAADTGSAASTAYAPAVKAASDRFKTIDQTPALQAAINNVAPDNFLAKQVLGAPQRDLQALRTQTELPGPTAPFGNAPSVADTMVRQSIVAQLKQAATNGSADELGKFSQSGFNRALDRIGDQRLSVYFSPQEIEQLKQAGRVASYTQVAPPGSAVNTSNSASAVFNLLSDMAGHIPGHQIIGVPLNMLKNGLGRYKQDNAVRAALSPD